MTRFLASESVTEGHPDKVCDVVSDAIVDAYIAQDPDSRVAVETAIKAGLVLLEGEVSAPTTLDHVEIARQAIRDIGYTDAASGLDPEGAGVINNIRPRRPKSRLQTFDDASKLGPKGGNRGEFGDVKGLSADQKYAVGADQGIIVGYATDETSALMPLPIQAANRLAERLAYVRKHGIIPELRPDGKVLVSVEYGEDLVPRRFHTLLISTQHTPDITLPDLRAAVRKEVVAPVLDPFGLDYSHARTVINLDPFINGGPNVDAGVTGRKIIVDTYGSFGGHGGGAFSGKDPRKPDRTAAYGARWVAKNIVAAGLAKRARIQLSYLHGIGAPASVDVEDYGTGTVPREQLQRAVEHTFDLRQVSLIDQLNLRRPIFRKTAAYGHFGRNDPDFTWEQTNRVEELREAAKAPARAL